MEETANKMQLGRNLKWDGKDPKIYGRSWEFNCCA